MISRNIRGTNPLVCLMLFSLAHEHKHKHISISMNTRETNVFVFLVLMLMLNCTSENSIRQLGGFVLMLMLMSQVFSLAYAYACAYAIVRTGLKPIDQFFFLVMDQNWLAMEAHIISLKSDKCAFHL